ncbi:UNVERIFIED_CONTAM: Serine/threonine-protein kinase SRPK [Sesamum radiatum]|uniref:non-specific serine/threonine protein kinase n=1 Tax=Sesamum radiatum TaxID=300843 RepID=A0AAW2V304_SESRA
MSSCSSGSEEEDEGLDSYRKGGYHAVKIADSFAAGRYIAQKKLGWGEFSTVWLAYDTQSSKYVALKIQKSAPQFAQAALHEIEVLCAITNGDPSNTKFVGHLVDHFKHTGPNGQHSCMVLEFLGDNLLRLIKSGTTPILQQPTGEGTNPSYGVAVNSSEKKLKQKARKAVARISERRGFVEGVEEVGKEGRCLDGVDLRCKVVDFGNACWESKPLAQEIQTRQYRAPEVILEAGYSCPVDMWSFACIAFELATGEMMFTPTGGEGYTEDEDHLALMMELLGKIPRKITACGARSKDYFNRYGDLKRIRRLKNLPLDKLLVDKYAFGVSDAREFAGFLCPLLDFDPEKRPTAQQCLQHPWLNINS